LAAEQLKDIGFGETSLLLEPSAKNTAPALTLAALEVLEGSNDPILVVTPSDQTIKNISSFNEAVINAIKVAETGSIVTLGVRPTSPEVGFGYINFNNQSGNLNDHTVLSFTEKPTAVEAEEYIKAGNYAWNSGIFILRASLWLKAIKFFRLDIYDAVYKSFKEKTIDNLFIRPDHVLFKLTPSESIDYAVMEKCPGTGFSIKMIPLDAGWSDLGTWDSVWEVNKKDKQGNYVNGDVLLKETSNSVIYSNGRLVSVLGVKDLVIVESDDAVLVSSRKKSQEVKCLVSMLESKGRNEHNSSHRVFRPWGSFSLVDAGMGFKVKRICVNPFASLSLQRHKKRAEHWVVVKGVAEVICGEKTIMLYKNQSTFIPINTVHRLSNPAEEPLEIIEVQSGDYLGEDDIERLEDNYGRK
jgi:mannose-1-phosphate guanylyltransferase/mannose-6-phosphate isomerase